jgi:hypothetical protein
MTLSGPLRYVATAAVAAVLAVAFFYLLDLVYSASREPSIGLIERWIVKATCENYELTGSVRDPKGVPIPFAIVEASYLDTRLTTRSGPDGKYRLVADRPVCERQPRSAAITVIADAHRPARQVLPFGQTTLDVVLQPSTL